MLGQKSCVVKLAHPLFLIPSTKMWTVFSTTIKRPFFDKTYWANIFKCAWVCVFVLGCSHRIKGETTEEALPEQ